MDGDGAMLHPTWTELADDLPGLAARCEASLETTSRLRDAIVAGKGAAELVAVLGDDRTGSGAGT
jgi:hypothetical protein